MQYEAMYQTLDGVVDTHTKNAEEWLNAMKESNVRVDDLKFLLEIIKPYEKTIDSIVYQNGYLSIIPRDDATVRDLEGIIGVIVYNMELPFDARLDHSIGMGVHIELKYESR